MNLLMNAFAVSCAIALAAPAALAAGSKDKSAQQSQGESAAMGGGSASAATGSSSAAATSEYKVIQFKKGETSLDSKSKQALKSMIDSANTKGKIDTVHVAVWSDQPFPKGEAELKDSEKNIASKRSDSIKNYVEDTLEVSSVEAHNMAEKTGWLARAFNTDEAELKSMFAQRGAPVTDQQFQVVKKNGGPMKAVIWLQMENQSSGSRSGSTESN